MADDLDRWLAEQQRELIALRAEREHARQHPQAWWLDR